MRDTRDIPDLTVYPTADVRLEDVATWLYKNYDIRSKCEDTRAINLSGEYRGTKRLTIYGLPHECWLELRSRWCEPDTCFAFTYEGRWFNYNMSIDNIVKFIGKEVRSYRSHRVEAETAKHAYWKYDYRKNCARVGGSWFECSCCGTETHEDRVLYLKVCPYCGAIMDMSRAPNKPFHPADARDE